jgi:hypothetical protein
LLERKEENLSGVCRTEVNLPAHIVGSSARDGSDQVVPFGRHDGTALGKDQFFLKLHDDMIDAKEAMYLALERLKNRKVTGCDEILESGCTSVQSLLRDH